MTDEDNWNFDRKVHDLTDGLIKNMFGGVCSYSRMNIVLESQPGRYETTTMTLDDLVRTVLNWGPRWDSMHPDKTTPKETIPG